MAILLIGLIILLCALAYGFLKPKRRTRLSLSHHSTAYQAFNGLFAEQLAEETCQFALQEAQARAKSERGALLARAGSGDTTALAESAAHHDADFYQQTLATMIEMAQGEPRAIETIADTIIANRTLRAGARLADLLMEREPNAKSVARLLYIAALSDDEHTYRRAVQTALRHCQQRKIAAADFKALLQSSYWLLAPEIRTANFSLQQLMAEVRRALAATPTPSAQPKAR